MRTHHLPGRAATALSLLLSLLLTACGGGGGGNGDDNNTPQLQPPAILSFTGSPAEVLPAQAATLSWNVDNVDQVRIEPDLGLQPAQGSASVRPLSTARYTLTAGNAAGNRSASTTLTVVVYDWTALAAALDAAVGSGDSQVPGYSFALEIAGRTVFRRGAGNLGVNTAVPIASASKAASAAAILALVDAGLIDLDEPVSTYLGDSIDWPIDKTTITMRMLLNHTSGLPFDSPCLADSSLTLQACAQEIANRTLTLPIPGSAFLYSGAGYQLAGYVAQQAAGMPWTELFEQYLGEPLGMSSFRYLGDENPRIGGGALSGTLDYLKLMRMLLDGGRANGQQVLSSDSAASVTADQISPRLMFGKPVDGSLDGYSNGWWLSAEDAHPGSAGPELSDPGLFGATPWMDFDKDYSAALWVVKDTASGVALWRQLRPLILQQIEAQGLPE